MEIVVEYPYRMLHSRGLLAMPDLQEKAFAKVSRADAGRIELLNHLQHGKHLFFACLYVCTERNIVHKSIDASSEISVIVQTADYEGSHRILMLCEIAVAQLFHKVLCKAFLHRERAVLRTLVLRIVVSPEAITRNRIVFLIF